MTRDRHDGYGIPSNARYRRHAYPLPDRTEHRPPSRRDVGEALVLVPVALAIFIAFLVGTGLAFAVLAGPAR